MSQLFKSLLITLSMSTLSVSAFAQTHEGNHDEIEISSQMQSTKEEIAAIQVLEEICPQIIGQNKNFEQGYQRLLSDFLPGFSDPKLALRALNEDSDYTNVLKQAREDAAKASREDNRAVCLGVIEWNQKK